MHSFISPSSISKTWANFLFYGLFSEINIESTLTFFLLLSKLSILRCRVKVDYLALILVHYHIIYCLFVIIGFYKYGWMYSLWQRKICLFFLRMEVEDIFKPSFIDPHRVLFYKTQLFFMNLLSVFNHATKLWK